jgi:hypothetical protein
MILGLNIIYFVTIRGLYNREKLILNLRGGAQVTQKQQKPENFRHSTVGVRWTRRSSRRVTQKKKKPENLRHSTACPANP